MIVTQGGYFGGWGLMIQGGRPEFVYRATERDGDEMRLIAPEVLSRGHHVLEADFHYDGGGLGKGARVTLQIDGRAVAQGKLKRSVSFLFGEDAAIGRDTGTALNGTYTLPFKFGGTIQWVKIHLAKAE